MLEHSTRGTRDTSSIQAHLRAQSMDMCIRVCLLVYARACLYGCLCVCVYTCMCMHISMHEYVCMYLLPVEISHFLLVINTQ